MPHYLSAHGYLAYSNHQGHPNSLAPALSSKQEEPRLSKQEESRFFVVENPLRTEPPIQLPYFQTLYNSVVWFPSKVHHLPTLA